MNGLNNSLGARLADERTRLELSQKDLAAACGKTRESIGKYERDVIVPGGDFFIALAKMGMDIQFVIAGVRSANIGQVAEERGHYGIQGVGTISREEQIWLEIIRGLDPDHRARLKEIGSALVSTQRKVKPTGS